MTYDEWLETYRPSLSFSGNVKLYETYGEDLTFIAEHPPQKIWTLVDDCDGGSVIIPGKHFVNRIGYYVCQNEWTDSNLEVEL